MARQAPKIQRVSEDMKRLAVMLQDELAGWPGLQSVRSGKGSCGEERD